jgi:hypothetical protein
MVTKFKWKEGEFKEARSKVGRWNNDIVIQEIDLYDVSKFSKCHSCDNVAVCYFTDKHHPEKPKGYYLCAKHKLLMENIFAGNVMDYEVRYLD